MNGGRGWESREVRGGWLCCFHLVHLVAHGSWLDVCEGEAPVGRPHHEQRAELGLEAEEGGARREGDVRQSTRALADVENLEGGVGRGERGDVLSGCKLRTWADWVQF